MATVSTPRIQQAILPISKILIPMPERRIASDTGGLHSETVDRSPPIPEASTARSENFYPDSGGLNRETGGSSVP